MTSATQFQNQGAYENYLPVGTGSLYIGTDVDNSNYSGSICSVAYFKRFALFTNASGGGSINIVVPGNSAIVSIKVENRQSIACTTGTLAFTGRGNGGTAQTFATVTFNATANAQNNVAAATAQNVVFTSNAPNSGGDYVIPDVGQAYATINCTATGLAVVSSFINLTVGFVDTSFYDVAGQ